MYVPRLATTVRGNSRMWAGSRSTGVRQCGQTARMVDIAASSAERTPLMLGATLSDCCRTADVAGRCDQGHQEPSALGPGGYRTTGGLRLQPGGGAACTSLTS